MTEKHQAKRSEPSNSVPVRIAYPNLHDKRTKSAKGKPLDKGRYDAVLLFPKLNQDPMQCANYQWLAKHCMDAATQAWGQWPQGGHWPIQDGDQVKAAAPSVPGVTAAPAKEYPWRKGHWIVEVKSYLDTGPKVCVIQNGQTVELPARVINGKAMYKSGDYGIVHMQAFTFANEKFGVNFGFEGVCFTAEGEAIGNSGGRTASQMFGGLAPMAAAPALPVPGAAPLPQIPAATAPQTSGYVAAAPAVPTMSAPPVAPTMPAPPVAPGVAPLPPLPGR